MEFLEFTKKLLKLRKENSKNKYSTNTLKQNKPIVFIWVEQQKDER